MADIEDLLRQQNELLKVLVRMQSESSFESPEESANVLDDFEFTHSEIGQILGKDRSTISKYLSKNDD